MQKEYAHQDLTDYDFSGADLRGANFSHAILHNTDFSYARLDGADFRFADLEGTTLRERLYLFVSAMHPSGTLLASGASSEQPLHIFDLAEQKLQRLLYAEAVTDRLAFHPSGNLLAAGDNSGRVSVWDLSSGRCVQRFERGIHFYVATPVSFSPDGGLLAAGFWKSGIALLETVGWQQQHFLTPRDPLQKDLLFRSDGRELLVGIFPSTLQFWDVQEGRLLHEMALPGNLRSLHQAPSSPAHLFALLEGSICLLDVEQRKILATFSEVRTTSIVPLNEEGQLAIKVDYSRVEVWDLLRRQRLSIWEAGKGSIANLHYHVPTSMLVAMLTNGTCVRIDLAHGSRQVIDWYPSCKDLHIFGVKGLRDSDRTRLLELGANEVEPAPTEKSAEAVQRIKDLAQPEQKLLGGYSKQMDRYYDLLVSLKRDGRICLRESYEYPARGESEEREYQYTLFIPTASRETFLRRLAREARVEPDPMRMDEHAYLLELFAKLCGQGTLANVEHAGAKENLDILKRWLEEEGILYKQKIWVWIS